MLQQLVINHMFPIIENPTKKIFIKGAKLTLLTFCSDDHQNLLD